MASLITSNSQDFKDMDGSCYCGTVTYKLKASPIFVNCCHCRNCQQLSGSAFSLNIMIEARNVEITSKSHSQTIDAGEESLTQSDGKPREGKGVKCPACGTLLWGVHPKYNNKIIFLRAGTLSESDRIVPDAHFFVRSKHPWITIPDGVRQLDGLGSKDDPPLWSPEGKRRIDAAL